MFYCLSFVFSQVINDDKARFLFDQKFLTLNIQYL